jgi:serine/threonine protein kinase
MIPAQYLAPEVAVGLAPGKASDIWALGCAIFRIRSGEDLFFDYDTDCPEDALQQIVKTLGEEKLPQEWRQTRFDEDGFAVADGEQGGEPFWTLEDSRPLRERVRSIVDEPKGLCVDASGEVVEMTEEPAPGFFPDWVALRAAYPDWTKGMVWKPTAVCVEGEYIEGYGEETDELLKAFPRIGEREAELLVDLLDKMFRYDPAERITAEEVVEHPWFALE